MSRTDGTELRLMEALAALLAATDANGDFLVYSDHREHIGGDERSPSVVMMRQCRIRDEVDDTHQDGCAAGVGRDAAKVWGVSKSTAARRMATGQTPKIGVRKTA